MKQQIDPVLKNQIGPVVRSKSTQTKPANPNSTPTANPTPVPIPNPRYALHKGLGFWEVFFQGKRGFFKHEQGAYYVAHLLLNPPERPMHALALTVAVATIRGRPISPLRIVDPATGHSVLLDGDGTLQQRSMGFEAIDTAWALRKTQLALEHLVDDNDQIEPVKAEALRDLEVIYNFQKNNPRHTRDTAQRAAHSVRTAILRFHGRLSGALDARGRPHPVLRPFAIHLEKYLLLPSGRYFKPGASRRRVGLAGCFTYEPPRGVKWES
jgi:hypothetical protein